jgi:hypothetical protein
MEMGGLNNSEKYGNYIRAMFEKLTGRYSDFRSK